MGDIRSPHNMIPSPCFKEREKGKKKVGVIIEGKTKKNRGEFGILFVRFIIYMHVLFRGKKRGKWVWA